MDSISGLIVLFIIVGLIEKFTKKSKANRKTAGTSVQPQTVQRTPRARNFFDDDLQEDSEDEAPAAAPAAVRPAVQPVAPAQPATAMPDSLHAALGTLSASTLLQHENAAAIVHAAPEKAEPEAASAKKPQSLIEQAMKAVGQQQKKAALRSGESVTDANGCIGGSLGAHDEEGETLAEHTEHLRARDAAISAERSVAEQAAELRSGSIAALRRAVVMAEILDKPVSLRRR